VRAVLRALVREPLVHFAILGASLFALDAATSQSDEASAAEASGAFAVPSGPIVVDATLRAALVEQWAKTHPAPPDAAQLEQLEQRWIDEEVLYREGLARSLADGDAVVRERIASQMAYVLQSRIVTPEPTEDELRAAMDASASTQAQADRVDFTQVFVAGTDDAAQARANELLHQLQGGADPDGLGDTYAGGRRFRARRIADLAQRLGDAFVEGLDVQREGTWALRRSDEGFHLVRIDRRTAAQAPDLDTVRHDWQQARRDEAMTQAKQELRSRWEIVVAP
jgi:hypothetical protein